jgi:hypothetical protein
MDSTLNPSNLSPEETQAFFDKNGYWPMTKPVKVIKPSARELARRAKKDPRSLMQNLHSSFLRGWRAPLHWTVPMAFEQPGKIYELLCHELGPEEGHEEFLRQVADYYGLIRENHVNKAQELHTRWAIRQICRIFETQVRGFRGQSVGRKGAIFPRSSGQEKYGPPNKPKYQDILTLPETLIADGRFSRSELEGYLRAFAVREKDVEAAAKEVQSRLARTWGVKP